MEKNDSYQIEILETGTDTFDHFQSLGMAVGAWIKRSVKSAANLFYPTLQLFALEKGYEDGLVYLVPL